MFLKHQLNHPEQIPQDTLGRSPLVCITCLKEEESEMVSMLEHGFVPFQPWRKAVLAAEQTVMTPDSVQCLLVPDTVTSTLPETYPPVLPITILFHLGRKGVKKKTGGKSIFSTI